VTGVTAITGLSGTAPSPADNEEAVPLFVVVLNVVNRSSVPCLARLRDGIEVSEIELRQLQRSDGHAFRTWQLKIVNSSPHHRPRLFLFVGCKVRIKALGFAVPEAT
jgi:hypothetical protein